ncbi:MAG: GHMP kinase [Planctomycetes bacterium]|nr:GHMP kinase [Planctomycetota bacterium]
MIHVQTASRLHFGFMSLNTGFPRCFGSIGLMVRDPGITVSLLPTDRWKAEGHLGPRAIDFARRFLDSIRESGSPAPAIPPALLRLDSTAPEHAGLGTGTQLGLAVGHAVALHLGLQPLAPAEWARRIGRGLRSAVGIHGFFHGGFLLDGGKERPDGLAPLIVRHPFPENWRVVLAVPHALSGLHGPDEQRALAEAVIPPEVSRELCREVLMEMLPGLVEEDGPAFGESLYRFNHAVGQCFQSVQGGAYASPRLAERVDFIRRQGIPGAGQSSWGPTVFAVCDDPERAEALSSALRAEFGPAGVIVTPASNEGAKAEVV